LIKSYPQQPLAEKLFCKVFEVFFIQFCKLIYLEPDHPAVEAIGLSSEDAERIGAGYAPRGILKGTVAIPVRDESGKLLGYIGAIDVKLPPSFK